MKGLDYVIRNIKDAVSYDEFGNMYIDFSVLTWEHLNSLCVPFLWLDNDTCFISKEDCDLYNQYNVIVPDDIEYNNIARRPYYRMRGKSVTEEQAFDIICKTDKFFSWIDEIKDHEDYIGGYHFTNWLINKNHFPAGYGWVHIDGTIGANGITDKYPEITEFVDEWFRILKCFPYLDLVIAITDWDENPYGTMALDYDCNFRRDHFWEYESYDKNFYDAVVLGIYIHDKTIEILEPTATVKKYKKYVSLYEKKRDIYFSDYYMMHDITQVDLPYLKRCIESYDLNADEILGELPESVWRKSIFGRLSI